MLIPSIDLQGGRIVQLVQGERLALATTTSTAGSRGSRGSRSVQLIDLDAAMNAGDNARSSRRSARRLPCRVGGGIRTVDRAAARARRAARARSSSARRCSAAASRDLDVRARRWRTRVGADRLIAAVDARGGRVVDPRLAHALAITPVEAVHALEPFFGEFLYTNVDIEGLMQGIDRDAIAAVRDATTRGRHRRRAASRRRKRSTGSTRIGVDAVVGMAIYTGRLKI